jgi:hypothetical protein
LLTFGSATFRTCPIALIEAGKADATGQSAKVKFEARCFDMLDLGLDPADLRGATTDTPIGRHREEALIILANTTLNKADRALYFSEGVENATVEVNGKKKREKTPKGQVRNRVSQSLGRIIAKMVALSGGNTREPKPLADRFLKQATAALSAIESNRTGETPEFGDAVRKVLVAAFQTISDTLDPQKAK